MAIQFPQYEIWGCDTDKDGDIQPFSEQFREDCLTLADAKIACQEWQSHGRAAWIVDKDTREMVKC